MDFFRNPYRHVLKVDPLKVLRHRNQPSSKCLTARRTFEQSVEKAKKKFWAGRRKRRPFSGSDKEYFLFTNNDWDALAEYVKCVNEAAIVFKKAVKGKRDEVSMLKGLNQDRVHHIHLKGIYFRDMPNFDFKRFREIEVGILFQGCVFDTQCNFDNLVFKGYVGFTSCEFNDLTTFGFSDFYGYVDFSNCTFHNIAYFQRVLFGGMGISPNFRNCIFKDRVSFHGSVLKCGVPDLRGAELSSYLDFHNVEVMKLSYQLDSLSQLLNLRRILLRQGDEGLAVSIHEKELRFQTGTKTDGLLRELGIRSLIDFLAKKILYVIYGVEKREGNALLYFDREVVPFRFKIWVWIRRKMQAAEGLFFVVFSWLYVLVNMRGKSLLLPLIWLVFFTYLMSSYFYEGGVQLFIPAPDKVPAWQLDLKNLSTASQSLLYSIQNTLWPIKVLAGSPLEAKTLSIKIWSVLHSTIATVFWYFFITGLRRQFKIDRMG